MRVLVVTPGPKFSVEDVCRGWIKGLRQNGCEVGVYDLGAAVNFFEAARVYNEEDDTFTDPFTPVQKILLGSDNIYGECFKGWPDLVLIISGFYIPIEMVPILRSRGMRVAYVFTESPYEDDKQIPKAEQADLVVLNDPTNLQYYPEGRAYYQPHSFDPDLHRPPTEPPLYDFTFCGTGYPSRIEFFEQVDWRDLTVRFEGNWPEVTDDSPIRRFLGDDLEWCTPNVEAVNDLYRRARSSANFYRREANRDHLSEGWAMGPREAELAACKTFFLRDPRPESDEVLGMLPSFSSPEEFTDKLHWWIAHPEERHQATELAAAAIAERTFENAARRLLLTLQTKE